MVIYALVTAALGLLFLLYVISVWRIKRSPVVTRIQVRPGTFEEVARRTMRQKGLTIPNSSQDPPTLSPNANENSLPHWQTGKTPTESMPGGDSEMKGALWAAALGDGLAPGVGVWERWSSVDEHVFQAMSHMTHDIVNGFADLLKAVNAKGYAVDTEGFFNNLKGHVGEWHVMEHFSQADPPVSVSMPWASNEPATDMWVDGHAVNVKTVADASRLDVSHFANHPDVAAVIPHDAANIPEGALHFDPATGFDPSHLQHSDHLVVVDHAFSHADVADQTHHAIDVLQDPGPAIHLPWITMAISGIREGRLLIKGHTDIVRAAKNIAIDGTAVGGGGLIGAKAGGLIGSVGGPVGSVVGAIIGGIAGAIGGRAVANDIKRKPLIDAKAAYDSAMSSYQGEEARVSKYTAVEWTKARESEQSKLKGCESS
jgi:hypothetical protein